MPFLKGPYAKQANRPPTTTTIVSSRLVNFETGRYELDDSGNALGMDDTASRVMLAHSFGTDGVPSTISGPYFERRRSSVLAALEELETEGAISVDDVTVVASSPGSGSESVRYNNKTRGQQSTQRVLGGRPSTLPSSPLFIFWNGQSNAVAQADGTVGYSAMTADLGVDMLGWDEGAGDWAEMIDHGAGVSTSGGQTGGGIVATRVCRRIADATGQTVRLIALAASGKGIDFFLPGSTEKAIYLDLSTHATKNNFELFVEYLAQSGAEVELIVFDQGEADAGSSYGTYYPKLVQLIEAYSAVCPKAHIILNRIIGDANGLLLGSSLAGVNAAVDAAVEAYAHVHSVSNADMAGNTAWHDGVHYRKYAGYLEHAERYYAKLQGTTRPNVSATADLEDIGVSWNHRWRYRHSIITTTTDEVAVWQDDISVKSLQSGTVNPDHIASDPNFGGRPSVDFDVGSATYSVAGMPAGNTYTFWGVWRLANVSVTQLLCELSGVARIGLTAYTAANPGDMSAWYAGGDVAFNDPGVPVMNTNAHSFGVVIDAANTEARLYLDGVLVGTETISGTETTVNPTFYFSGFVSVANFFKGQVAEFALSTEAMDDDQAALAHAYAVVEYPSLSP